MIITIQQKDKNARKIDKNFDLLIDAIKVGIELKHLENGKEIEPKLLEDVMGKIKHQFDITEIYIGLKD